MPTFANHLYNESPQFISPFKETSNKIMVDIKRFRAAVLKLVVETLCRVAKLTLPPKSKMFVL